MIDNHAKASAPVRPRIRKTFELEVIEPGLEKSDFVLRLTKILTISYEKIQQ